MKVLGAPTQNILETVVREAVQNSWDAKAGKGPVRFGVEAYALSRQQRDAVTTALSQGLRQKPAVLELPGPREQFDAIAIFDRGTGGLGGPLTAWSADEEDGDFARFVFSIGETKPQAGKILERRHLRFRPVRVPEGQRAQHHLRSHGLRVRGPGAARSPASSP